MELKARVSNLDVSSSTNESNIDVRIDDYDEIFTYPIQPQEEEYTIARDISRRQIKISARYADDNLTAYALSIAQEINDGVEPAS